MSHGWSEVTDYISQADTVLLLAPSQTTSDHQACTELLTQSPPERTNVLSITLEMTPDQRLAIWQQIVGEAFPKRATILDARTGTDASGGVDTSVSESALEVDVLSPSAGLTDLGLAIARTLGAWSETQGPTHVCLHSVTALLTRFETNDVGVLITSLNDLQSELNVRTHHHLDPTACEESTLATLRPLYDAVLEYSDGGWIVSEDTDSDVSPSFQGTAAPRDERSTVAAEGFETIPMRYSFDTIFELLSSPVRRMILYHLKELGAGEFDIETVLDDIHSRSGAVPVRESRSRDELAVACHHNHFPVLEEAGVIDLNEAEGTLRYDPNEALESCLQYVETLELG